MAELTAAAKAYQADPQFMKDRISVHQMVSAAKNAQAQAQRRRSTMTPAERREAARLSEGDPSKPAAQPAAQQPARPPPPGIRPDQPYPLDKIYILVTRAEAWLHEHTYHGRGTEGMRATRMAVTEICSHLERYWFENDSGGLRSSLHHLLPRAPRRRQGLLPPPQGLQPAPGAAHAVEKEKEEDAAGSAAAAGGGPADAPSAHSSRGLDALVAEIKDLYARALRMKLNWSLHEPAVREATRAVADLNELFADGGAAGEPSFGNGPGTRPMPAWEKNGMAADLMLVRFHPTGKAELSARCRSLIYHHC